MKTYCHKILFFLSTLVVSSILSAQQVPGSFTYQGQITKAGGAPLEADPVMFTVRIYSPTNDCLLFEEQHSINMLGSEGAFSLNVGTGIRSGTDFEDTSSIVGVFQNGFNFTGITTCAAGTSYNALTGHTRKVRIAYNDGTGLVTLAQDFHLQTVPYAWYANSLQGLSANNFVHINAGQNLTQGNLENLLGGSNYNTLYNLASDTSTTPLNLNNQQIKNLANPTLPQDAATKNYADMTIAGSTVDVSGVGAGVGDGRVLSWNATLSRWEAITPSSITDATKLPLVGGTMAGDINMNGNQILNTNHITMQNLSTITLGKYTTAQEVTLVGSLAVGNKGATWFNSTTNKMMCWDGTAANEVSSGSATGDITAVNTSAGSALSGGVTTGDATIAVVTDNTTIEVNGTNQLQVRDGGITNAKITSATVDKITSAMGLYFSYAPNNAACVDGEVLKWNSITGWECGTDNNAGGVTSVFARTGAVTAQAGDYTATQITNTAAGNIAAVTTQGAINELDNEKVAKAGDTMTGTLNLPTNGLVLGTDQLVAVGGNIGIGTATATTKLQVEGTIKIGDGGETCSIAANAGMVRYSAAALQYCNGSSWQILGVSGAGLTTLNGQTGSTQVFTVTATGLAPAINSATNTHTLSIPLASGAGVTSGTISKTDYDNFVAKLSTVTGSALPAGQVWIGDGSNQAAAVTLSGDATVSSAGVVAISANTIGSSKITDGSIITADLADSSVTSSKIVDGTIATADIANLAVNDGKISDLSVNKIASGVGQYFTYAPNNAACVNGEVLKWNSITGWECGTDTGGVTDHGLLAGLTDDDHTQYVMLAGRAGGQNLRGGTAASDDLTIESTSNAIKGDVILQSTGGNVGIGTTAPSDKLHVVGDIRVGTSGANGCLKDFSGGTIAGTCSSDARLKRNFRLLGPVSDKLLKISPKFYQWRSDEFPEKHFGNQEELGLVAQDLLEVIPELVQVDDGGLYRVRYQQIPFYLIKGFAEQQEAIKSIDDKYSREIASLKIENAQIKLESVKIRSEYQQIKTQSQSLEVQNLRLQERLNAIEKKLNLK